VRCCLCGGVWVIDVKLVVLLWLFKEALTRSLVVTLDLTLREGMGELETLSSSALLRLQDEPAGLEPKVASGVDLWC
jgi:hypothetical protein